MSEQKCPAWCSMHPPKVVCGHFLPAPSARCVCFLAWGGPVGCLRAAPARQANSNLGSALSERMAVPSSTGGSVVDLVKAIQREEVRVHVNLAERIGVRLHLSAVLLCSVCACCVHAGHLIIRPRHRLLPHGSGCRQSGRSNGQGEEGPCFAFRSPACVPLRCIGGRRLDKIVLWCHSSPCVSSCPIGRRSVHPVPRWLWLSACSAGLCCAPGRSGPRG